MPRHVNDMICAGFAGDFNRVIFAAVINNKDFDLVKTLNGAGDQSQCLGEGLGLVVAGDLNDKFHKDKKILVE